MFGDCEAAKPEHRGRTEQRSASDLSTQTTALLLSSAPQTDKDLMFIFNLLLTENKVFPSFENKNISKSITPHLKKTFEFFGNKKKQEFGLLLPWRWDTHPNKGSEVALLWNVYPRRRG